ncbi:hypothetical protein QBC37DRAFT_370683 [Rhypophila decipiens]|uniref:RNase H type-1 domain-containing protein n=1 Tax=Rhypophila decipiens TaxID=261697 RepID=A0AAN6YEX6_9PEZI|nr:hypothetical protein QBC37DRAFT_370683 [Rhypophila decipiens]
MPDTAKPSAVDPDLELPPVVSAAPLFVANTPRPVNDDAPMAVAEAVAVAVAAVEAEAEAEAVATPAALAETTGPGAKDFDLPANGIADYCVPCPNDVKLEASAKSGGDEPAARPAVQHAETPVSPRQYREAGSATVVDKLSSLNDEKPQEGPESKGKEEEDDGELEEGEILEEEEQVKKPSGKEDNKTPRPSRHQGNGAFVHEYAGGREVRDHVRNARDLIRQAPRDSGYNDRPFCSSSGFRPLERENGAFPHEYAGGRQVRGHVRNVGDLVQPVLPPHPARPPRPAPRPRPEAPPLHRGPPPRREPPPLRPAVPLHRGASPLYPALPPNLALPPRPEASSLRPASYYSGYNDTPSRSSSHFRPSEKELENEASFVSKAGTPENIDGRKLFAGIVPKIYYNLKASCKFPVWGDFHHPEHKDISISKAHELACSKIDATLNIWADGSARADEDDHHAVPKKWGYAIVFRNPDSSGGGYQESDWAVCRWKEDVWSSNDSELLALCEAINMVKALRTTHPHWMKPKNLFVTISSDSKKILKYLHEGQNLHDLNVRNALLQPGIEKFLRLVEEVKKMGCHITLRWIPGHHHTVLPHELADQNAGVASMGNQPMQSFVPGLGTRGNYEPIGPDLAEQMMAIAKRHPHLDESGANYTFALPTRADVQERQVSMNYRPGKRENPHHKRKRTDYAEKDQYGGGNVTPKDTEPTRTIRSLMCHKTFHCL